MKLNSPITYHNQLRSRLFLLLLLAPLVDSTAEEGSRLQAKLNKELLD
jgi:hypothetical protein